MDPTCPQCHVTVRPTDFFCFNCGKNLHAPPMPTTPLTEAMYYLGSILLPPLGIFWGLKYLKQDSDAAKRIGIVSIALTVVSLIVATSWTMNLFRNVSSQLDSQLQVIQGL